jgi:hypothetical protein
MSLITRAVERSRKLLDAIKEARNPSPPQPPRYAIKHPTTGETIPLPTPRTWKHKPSPAEVKAESRRIAHALASTIAGKPVTWKQAKVIMDKLAREERAQARAMAKQQAATRSRMTGASA